MLEVHISLSMLLRGWLVKPHPYQVPGGYPWQRVDQ